MREIKFRAWDKENQRIIKARPYISSIVTSEKQDLYTSGTDSTQLVISLKGVVGDVWPGPESYGLVSNVEFDVQDYILLQYTGLKDKNGMEIYEGDIVSVAHQKYLSTGDERFYKNGYNNRVVKWRVTSHHNGWNVYNAPQTQFEVIGNIYENPELLNEK